MKLVINYVSANVKHGRGKVIGNSVCKRSLALRSVRAYRCNCKGEARIFALGTIVGKVSASCSCKKCVGRSIFLSYVYVIADRIGGCIPGKLGVAECSCCKSKSAYCLGSMLCSKAPDIIGFTLFGVECDDVVTAYNIGYCLSLRIGNGCICNTAVLNGKLAAVLGKNVEGGSKSAGPCSANLEVTSCNKTGIRAVGPSRRDSGKRLYVACMRLKKHLGNTCSSTQVTVDLERGMEIPKVGSGINLEQLLEKIVSSLAVLNTRPEVESVSYAPAGSLVATLGKCVLSRIKPSGSGAINNVAGIKSDKLRYVSVSVFSKVTVVVLLKELLDLTGISDSNRIVLVDLSKNCLKNCIILVRHIRRADTKLLSRKKKVVVVLICKGLCVSGTLRGVVPNTVDVLLGRIGADRDVIAIGIFLYHLGNEARGGNKNGIYNLSQNVYVTGIRIIFPKELSGKSKVAYRL